MRPHAKQPQARRLCYQDPQPRRLCHLVLAALLAGLVSAGPAGCANFDPTAGYTMASQYRQGIRTVCVPVWQRGSREFRRDLEIRLTEALVKRIEAETPYKVVDRSRADSLLTGTLRKVDQRVLSFDPRTGQARDIELRLVVDFVWKDLRTGEILAEKKDFRVSADYIPPAPLAEDFFQGSEDALNRLAGRIVEQLAQPW